MAVTTLPRTRARRAPLVATTLPPLVLVIAVLPLGLDLLASVHSALAVGATAIPVAFAGALGLSIMWARYPRTSWLAAAVLAAVASLAMRLVGAEVAPMLSLLAVLAVGVGGGFAPPNRDLDDWFELQPSVARR